MIARMGSATARVPLEKPDLLKAPLFGQLIDQLSAERRWVVLDLGTSSTALLELLADSRSRVEVADLYGSGAIDDLNAALQDDDTAILPRIAEQALPAHAPDAPVDVVLCWDLFNYIEPGAISALTEVIEQRARPGTLAHGLVVYSETDMPAEPGRFRPAPDSRLLDTRTVTGVVPAPRYTPEALSRMMGRFTIERAMLLGNGMQEFLFRLQ